MLTVLDKQRRMRAEIFDLTRPEYADAVEIQDHECTLSQQVADRYFKSSAKTASWKSASKS